VKIRMLVSVGGTIGPHDSPQVGEVIDVDEDMARAWADGERAELADDEKATPSPVETATIGVPERAVRPPATTKRPGPKRT
jgi:hypothetical protein